MQPGHYFESCQIHLAGFSGEQKRTLVRMIRKGAGFLLVFSTLQPVFLVRQTAIVCRSRYKIRSVRSGRHPHHCRGRLYQVGSNHAVIAVHCSAEIEIAPMSPQRDRLPLQKPGQIATLLSSWLIECCTEGKLVSGERHNWWEFRRPSPRTSTSSPVDMDGGTRIDTIFGGGRCGP